MSRFLSRRTALAASAVLTVMMRVAAAEPAAPSVVIRVYDRAWTDASLRQTAIKTAEAIVVDAGIHARWRDCTGDTDGSRCQPVRGATDLVLRIVPSAERATAVPPALAYSSEEATVLGFAVLDPATGRGVLGTIFMNRVLIMSARNGVSSSALLGRAMAHEAGHLLLGTGGHGTAGLMREVWTDTELTLDRPEDWLFAPAEREHLQARYEAARQ